MQHSLVSKLYKFFLKLKTKIIIKSFASYLIVLDNALYQTSDSRPRPSRALADTSSAGVYFEWSCNIWPFYFLLIQFMLFFLFKCPIIMHVILNIYQVYCSPAEFNQILLVWWLRSEVLLDTTSESRTDACNPGWWPLHWFFGIIESYNDLILLFLYMCY